MKYYRALAAATPRVKIETIGKSDEDRELVVVWVSSDENIKNLQKNRDNLAKIADPRGLSDEQIRQLVATTKPHYHFMGGLHSGETGPSEMLMELVYRLATETSPLIKQIRENVIVSVTPQADPDGRDRNVDWFYRGSSRQTQQQLPAGRGADAPGAPAAAAADAAPAAGRAERWLAGGGGTRRRRPPVLGQVRLSRQQPRHQPLADVDAGDCRLVFHRVSADHARPARVAAAPLYLQRRRTAESRISIRSSSPSCPGSRTSRWRR